MIYLSLPYRNDYLPKSMTLTVNNENVQWYVCSDVMASGNSV